MTPATPPFIYYVLEYWPLITAAVFVIATWVRYSDRITALVRRIKSMECRIEAAEKRIQDGVDVQNTINVRLGEIQRDILWIRERLSQK